MGNVDGEHSGSRGGDANHTAHTVGETYKHDLMKAPTLLYIIAQTKPQPNCKRWVLKKIQGASHEV